jgi:hypothetical protein
MRYDPPMPGGRPSSYTEKRAQILCERISAGELLINLVREPDMPDWHTIYRWQDDHPEFRQRYARARQIQAHACAERAVNSARNASAEDAHAARVQFDGDRWLASKLLASVYGDKTELHHTGGLTVSAPINPEDLHPEQLAVLEEIMLAPPQKALPKPEEE